MGRNTTNDTNRGYVAPQAPKPGMGYTPPPPPTQQTPTQAPVQPTKK